MFLSEVKTAESCVHCRPVYFILQLPPGERKKEYNHVLEPAALYHLCWKLERVRPNHCKGLLCHTRLQITSLQPWGYWSSP